MSKSKFRKKEIFENLVEWAANESSLNINAFCTTQYPPVPPKYLIEWSEEKPYYDECFGVAKAYLAARREQAVSDGRLHPKAYENQLLAYDKYLEIRKDQLKVREYEIIREHYNSDDHNYDLVDVYDYLKEVQ